jgi:hypothetical protein
LVREGEGGNNNLQKGKWYYEAIVHSDGLFQIGWVNDLFVAKPEVRNSPFSSFPFFSLFLLPPSSSLLLPPALAC